MAFSISRLLGVAPPLVPVVRLTGAIFAGGSAFKRGLSLQRVASPLERAFKVKGARAVALVINSPGGSPAQSSLIAGRIRAHAAESGLPVLGFVEDAAASGGYWLACSADEIFVDPSSIVGSIGVVSAGFGFQEAIAKLGVERRLHTAGGRKAILDPFQPEREEDVADLKVLQGEIHETFKSWVRERRGERLKGEEDDLFSGAFWTGGRAIELGLADGMGQMREVLRARYGKKVRLVPMDRKRGLFSGLLGGGQAEQRLEDMGLADMGPAMLQAAEERMIWQRLGL